MEQVLQHSTIVGQGGTVKVTVDVKAIKKAKAKRLRQERDEAMRSMGMVKVKGCVTGRIYWE